MHDTEDKENGVRMEKVLSMVAPKPRKKPAIPSSVRMRMTSARTERP